MSTLASLLMGLAGPMLLRALTVVGVGTVTFTGVTQALEALITNMQSSWSALPAAMLALASIAGVPQALGIVVGAQVARVALWAASSATKFVLGASS